MPDRDRSVEHMLRRVLSARRSASTQSPCVDGETLAAWTSGSLGAALAADVERHVADCARCQAMMAVFVQTEPVAPTTETIWRRWRLGWVVPLATAATAAALWIALPGNSTLPPPPTADTASRSVAVAPESPAAASDQLSAAVPRESAAPPPSAIRERLDAGAGNEARKQLDEAPRREPTEERFAAAAPPPAPAVAAPAESAEADRRELAANASARTFAARATAAPLEIVAPGGVARWRIVNGQQIERTTSAGADWTPVAIDSPEVLTSGAARSSSVCWIVGRRGAVYLTTDGLRFVRLPFPETIDLVSVMAADDRTATVSAADGRSWQTIDRGITWSALR